MTHTPSLEIPEMRYLHHEVCDSLYKKGLFVDCGLDDGDLIDDA
jgi:hypothetical protein